MIGHLLNRALTVYRSGYTPDDSGGRVKTSTEHGTIRAKVDQPSSAERMAAAQLGATLDYVVHTTRHADVQRGDELDDGGTRRLRVRAVLRNSHDTYTRLECEVIQGG